MNHSNVGPYIIVSTLISNSLNSACILWYNGKASLQELERSIGATLYQLPLHTLLSVL